MGNSCTLELPFLHLRYQRPGFAGLFKKLNFAVERSEALKMTALELQQVALVDEALSPVIQGFSL